MTGPVHVAGGNHAGIAVAEINGQAAVVFGDNGLRPFSSEKIIGLEMFFAEEGLLLIFRVEMLQGAAPSLTLVNALESAAQGFSGELLLGGIHGGLHGEAGFVDVILAVAVGLDAEGLEVVGSEEFDKQAPGFLEVPFGCAGLAFWHAPVDKGLIDGFLVVLGGDPAEGLEAAEHLMLALLRGFRMAERIVAARRLGHARDHGRLGESQAGSGFAEIRLGRGFNAVGVLAEINIVEVKGEDPVLGELVFQLDGQDGFLHFTRVAAFGREEQLFHKLLRYGAAALALGAAGEVHQQGAQDGYGVDARMFVEGAVFNGQERHGQVFGHVAQRDDKALLVGERAQNGAVTGVDGRGLRGIELRDLVEFRQIAGNPDEEENDADNDEDAAGEEQPEESADKMPEAAVTLARRFCLFPFFLLLIRSSGLRFPRLRALRGNSGSVHVQGETAVRGRAFFLRRFCIFHEIGKVHREAPVADEE